MKGRESYRYAIAKWEKWRMGLLEQTKKKAATKKKQKQKETLTAISSPPDRYMAKQDKQN